MTRVASEEDAVVNAFLALSASCQAETSSRNLGLIILALYFVKAIQDLVTDQSAGESAVGQDGLRFHIPDTAALETLSARHQEPGNEQRIAGALADLEAANPERLTGVLMPMAPQAEDFGPDGDARLGVVLETLTGPAYDLRPRRFTQGMSTVRAAFDALLIEFASIDALSDALRVTPPTVSDLVVGLMDIKDGESVYDPSCGVGSILARAGGGPTEGVLCSGQDDNRQAVSLARMIMLLNGQDTTVIREGGALEQPAFTDGESRLQKFDVVLSRPPLSVDPWRQELAFNDPYFRFLRGIPSRHRGTFAFVLHMVESMTPDTGRMGIIVPHGVLFRGMDEGLIRKTLIQENLIDAVIGLPEKLFPESRIPAAILVLRRNKVDDRILFVDATEFSASKRAGGRFTARDVEEVLMLCNARKSHGRTAYLASAAEIRANDYNCNLTRYLGPYGARENFDLEMLRKQRESLVSRLSAFEPEINARLDAFWK